MISVWNKSLAKATTYTAIASAWISKHGPIYWSKVEPWLSAGIAKAQIGLRTAADAAAPVLDPAKAWLSRTIPPIVDHIRDKLLPVVYNFARDFSAAVVAVLIEFGRWIQEHLLTGSWSLENLSTSASSLVSSVHSSVGQAAAWLSGQVRALAN